jgi:MFS family permease
VLIQAELRPETAYRILSGDDSDERVCEAIPESACTDLPRNYLLNVANGACTKLAEQIGGPNLVLPWLLGALGTPAALIGLLMPVKQLGSLAPQLLVSGWIRQVARRKWVWAGAGLTQMAALLLIALFAMTLAPTPAGVAVLGLLVVFSVASGAGSVAFQDISGKTIPKGRRGRLLSNRAFIGGVLTVAAGLFLQHRLGDAVGVATYAVLVALAALLWGVAAMLFALLAEQPGATEGGRNMAAELRAGLDLFRRTPGYRQYVRVRALLLSVEVAMPFYALHGQALFGSALGTLGLFVLAVGLGSVLSSPIWGRFSDRSSRHVLVVSGLLALLTAVLALAVGQLADSGAGPWLYGAVFVLVGIAEQGVRLGRKTYLVDGAPADERPLYLAFSNTAVGVLALLAGLIGVLAERLGSGWAVLLLGVLGLLGAGAARALPEADRMVHSQARTA